LVSAERRGLLQGVKIVGLVLDEVHHTYTGDETSEVVEGLVRRVVGGGGFAIGLTATPTKEALKLLGENLLYSALSAQAMVEGVLVGKLTIRYTETKFDCPPEIDPWKYEIPQRAEAYSKKILETLGGKVSSKVLVVAPNVSEADMIRDRLAEMLENSGEGSAGAFVRTAHYREADPMDVIGWFREAGRGILVTVNMADIGFDVPDLEVLVLARKFSSPVAYTQVRGRVLRKPPNTEAGVRKAANGAMLVDLAGSSTALEPMVPDVELGRLQEKDEDFYSDLRGFQPVARRDIQTQVGELRDIVLDATALKELEERVVRSLIKRPYPLKGLVLSLGSAEAGQLQTTISTIFKTLKNVLNIVEGERRFRIPPENAIIWLALREGVDMGDGWVSISKARVKDLIKECTESLDSLLAQYKLLFKDGGETVRVYVADWRRLLAIGRNLTALEKELLQIDGRFWHRLDEARKRFRQRLGEYAEDVDLHLKVQAETLLNETRWDGYAKSQLASASQRLRNGAMLIIRLTVHGQQIEVNMIVKLLSKALSYMVNADVRVLLKGRHLLKLGLEDVEEAYTNLLGICKAKAEEAGEYSKPYNRLVEKIRERLVHIKKLNIVDVEVFVKLAS
jgi:hypothetical protein